MRRLSAVAAAAIAMSSGGAAHGASITIEMTPTVGRSAVKFTYLAAAADTLLPNYVVNFTVTGSISSYGVTTTVTDRWDGLMYAPYGIDGERSYPAPPNSTIALTYTVRVVAPSGVPTATCVGTVTRKAGSPPTVTGGC